jgi:hypothetical protein
MDNFYASSDLCWDNDLRSFEIDRNFGCVLAPLGDGLISLVSLASGTSVRDGEKGSVRRPLSIPLPLLGVESACMKLASAGLLSRFVSPSGASAPLLHRA